MKKSYKKQLIFFAVLLVVLSVAVRIVVGLTFKEDDSADSFFSRRYTSYNGGKEAQVFFEKYVALTGYKDLSFHYSDAEKAIGPYKFYTCFVVDVYYSETAFYSIAADILPQTDVGTVNIEELELWLGSFSPTEVSISEKWDKKHGCGIMFDPERFTIRYAFVYNCGKVDRYDIIDLVDQSIYLNWNSEITEGTISDPLFAYDD